MRTRLMKLSEKYDHEPTIMELFEQLEQEYAYVPDFLPPNVNAAIICKTMTANTLDLMFT